MANERQSVFVPLQTQDLVGPFSGALTPPSREQQPMPPAPVSAAGGIAMVASEFFDKLTRGRIRNFEQQENEKLQNWNKVNTYVTNVLPTLTPEGQEKVRQLYFQALGPRVVSAIDEMPSKGGKPMKRGMSSRSVREAEGKPQDATHHFLNILRDVGVGMAGGKLPKGVQEVDPHAVIGNMALIASDPQYSREGAMTAAEGDIKKALEGYEGYREGAKQRIADPLRRLYALDRERGAAAEATHLGGFRSAPAVGSPAEMADRLARGLTQPPSPVVASSSAPPEPVHGSGPREFLTEGLTPPAPVAPGPPSEPTYNRVESILYDYAKLGSVGNPQDVEVLDASGKVAGRLSAFHVNTPSFSGWVDASTEKPVKGTVRIASNAQPRADRWSTEKVIKDKDSPTGWSYESHNLDDTSAKPRIVKGAPVPTSALPRSAGRSSQVNALTQRKVATLEALSKVMQQTPPPKGPDGKPLGGMEAANYYLDHIRQFYGQDKSVAPYLADIQLWLTEEARKGSFKEPKDVERILREATGKAQQQLQNEQQLQNIQQVVMDGMSELWNLPLGAPAEGSGQQDPGGFRE